MPVGECIKFRKNPKEGERKGDGGFVMEQGKEEGPGGKGETADCLKSLK